MDNGNTWSVVTADPHPSNPSDSEATSYAFAVVGMATLRAVATDARGQTGTSIQTVMVSRASQAAVAISPASSTVIAGQSVSFLASGGTTGNYA